MTCRFSGGKNIAMKVPPHQHEATVRFYRDVLKLERVEGLGESSVVFKFGENHLWIDKVPAMSQAELWLEIITDNTEESAKILQHENIVRCDEVEPLGPSFDGYWISSPCSIIHLVNGEKSSA